MKRRPIHKSSVLFLLGAVLLCVAALGYLFTSGRDLFALPGSSPTDSYAESTTPVPLTPVPTCKQQSFQTGVAFPQWKPTGYGSNDTKWLTELAAMRAQTGACWIEMPLLLHQDTASSTEVKVGQSTPTLENFTYGLRAAHTLGFHVFITPLVNTGEANPWSGTIKFATYQEEAKWFASYWQTLKPYVTAAAQTGVEQIAIGTELEWLQKNAPDTLWNGLIANIRTVFSGTLTYDTNWTTLQLQPPTWMSNPDLKMIGVSAYLSLVQKPIRVDPTEVAALWKENWQAVLDNFASTVGKPIILSEVGYRNSADALYHSWEWTSPASADPEEQAAGCDAVLANIMSDPQISGSFFWAWDEVTAFSLKGQPAATILHNRYGPLQA